MKRIIYIILPLLFVSTASSNMMPYGSSGTLKIDTLPNLYVICIGNNQFDNHILDNSENDAKDLSKKIASDFLESDEYFDMYRRIIRDSIIEQSIDQVTREKTIKRIVFNGDNKELISITTNEKGEIIDRIVKKIPQVFSTLLLKELATKTNVYNAINKIAERARPNDMFVFYYGGISLEDSLGNTDLYLYNTKINGDKKQMDVVPIKELALLLQKISADKQLFIAEAGNGSYFAQNMLSSFFDDDEIYEQTQRSRTIITTRELGLDASKCDPSHGPLASYLLKTENIINIFNSRAAFYSQVYGTRAACKEDNQDYLAIYREEDYRLFNTLKNKTFKRKSRASVGGNTNEEVIINQENADSKTYALVIGNDKYDGIENWDQLDSPSKDARAISKILKTKYNCEVIELIDQSRKTLKDSLRSIYDKIDENDRLIFFMASHGYFEPKTKTGHLVFQESESYTTSDTYFETYMHMSEIQTLLNNVKANNVFAIFDVCFGASFDLNGKDLSLTDYKNTTLDISLNDFITRQSEKQSRIFMTSGEGEVPDQYWDNSSEHSPFADKLIKTLEKEDKFICPGKLYNELLGNETAPVLKSFGSHVPQGDFLIAVDNDSR